MSDTQGTHGNSCLKWKFVAEITTFGLPHLGGWVEANQSFFEKVQNGPKVMVKI